jgi:3-hydroxybutyryl-CoA dehydrogenase
MKNIAVIGAGTMGNGIAHSFAQNGFNVAIVDTNEEVLGNALKTIQQTLRDKSKKA